MRPDVMNYSGLNQVRHFSVHLSVDVIGIYQLICNVMYSIPKNIKNPRKKK